VKRSLGQSDGHGSARLEDVFAAQRARISRNLDVRIERMRNRIAVQTYGAAPTETARLAAGRRGRRLMHHPRLARRRAAIAVHRVKEAAWKV
jgi:hypothetical protein